MIKLKRIEACIQNRTQMELMRTLLIFNITHTEEWWKAYDYLNGMVYETIATGTTEKTELAFIATPEGRAVLTRKVLNTTTDPSYGNKHRYEYSLKDHLGNLRVSCRCGEPKRDAQGTIIPQGTTGAGIDLVASIQEQHYDAWGLTFTQPTNASLEYKHKYNGKEQIQDLGVGLYEYGARMYMSEIGKWNGVDPLAEKADNLTPYRYCFNNPVLFIDPASAQGLRFSRDPEHWFHKEEMVL